jgi:hypothetical protein
MDFEGATYIRENMALKGVKAAMIKGKDLMVVV